jgi:aspartate aminotransferase
MIPLADRLTAVVPSASAVTSAAAKVLVEAGADIIDLGVGEPDFDTPAHIVDAAHRAALAGDTRYPFTGGTAAAKAAVIAKLARENQVEGYTPSEVIISNGAKQVIFNAFLATLNPGDELLLCAPYFGPYASAAAMIGATTIAVDGVEQDGFKVTPDQVERAISPRTRWLLLNHPANPSGVTYTAEELQALGAVVARHPHVNVMSDEIYEHIIFDGRPFVSFAEACPGLRDRTLIVNGVSKAYAMTGWRVGWGAGPTELITAMTTVQSQATSGVCSIAQAAAVAALEGPQDHLAEFRAAFERRRDLVVDRVASIPELSLAPPGGAFYAYIGCGQLMGMTTPEGVVLQNDADVARYLLDGAGVASVPGAAYGMSPFFRISTASADGVLAEALDRIAAAIGLLTRR